MTSVTDLREMVDVVIGVDTHVHTHSAAAVDTGTGGVVGQITVEATADGYAQLVEFADQHATLRAWAIEGTGGHGAGATRYLQHHAELVIELDRPERTKRRNGAKSDPLDAIRAAREALSRTRLGTPRSGGDRQALSVLLAARRSAIHAATDAQRQVFSLVVAAPEQIRTRFRGQKLPAMLTTASHLRVHPSWDAETTTTVTVLRCLARRAHAAAAEAAQHQKAIHAIVRSWRPDLLQRKGIGPIVAATVLCAWSHPGRIHSEAAFAMLAGAAPIPANSGQTTNRYRLNRHGDRQLNRALHTIVLSRIRYDQATRTYAARRTREGKTNREIKRCLKRYIARDLYRLLESGNPTATP
ncbi:IS110 family transposase [Actinocatenispora thailandica]|uniref:IS110 family transposase n=1 Tax=Actinocatenispora thailandica TaxID=227318 RepID=A0A7R7DXP7_9ACTN|nr:IS110 family transposase [Actinocatenispora thailandica]BCJ33830.1 IS110 family transposase [Actinocatenispora thailandica]BCJ39332.1 IS110 family transposase [Actinocatenispora thailandica]